MFPCLLCCTNLCVVGRLIFYGKRAVAATKVVGAMAHQQGCQFAINAVRRPVFGNADDPGAVLPQKRPKVFDVDRENDASLLARQLVDCGVGKSGEMKVVLDVFDVEVCIETSQNLAGR